MFEIRKAWSLIRDFHFIPNQQALPHVGVTTMKQRR